MYACIKRVSVCLVLLSLLCFRHGALRASFAVDTSKGDPTGIGPHTKKHDDDELPYPSASTATPLVHHGEQASDPRSHQGKRKPLMFRPMSSMGQARSTRPNPLMFRPTSSPGASLVHTSETLDVQNLATRACAIHTSEPLMFNMNEVKHPTTKISSVFASIDLLHLICHILAPPPLPNPSTSSNDRRHHRPDFPLSS